MAGYSKTPFIKKMGMKESMRGVLVHAPKEVLNLFERAPIDFTKALSGKFDYIHLFSKDEKSLKSNFPRIKKFLKTDSICWVSWPKSRKLGTDLDGNKVRRIGLATGLVDVKVAAIDDTWSGLKFVYR